MIALCNQWFQGFVTVTNNIYIYSNSTWGYTRSHVRMLKYTSILSMYGTVHVFYCVCVFTDIDIRSTVELAEDIGPLFARLGQTIGNYISEPFHHCVFRHHVLPQGRVTVPDCGLHGNLNKHKRNTTVTNNEVSYTAYTRQCTVNSTNNRN